MLLSGTLVASLATLVIVQKILLRAIFGRNIRRGLGRATMKLLISIVYKKYVHTLYQAKLPILRENPPSD